jgi:hypothetical protein
MLLRRFTQHVGRQDWFAVFLDLFIVVFGIWLAFQISEWADDRHRRVELDEQLIALSDDLSEDVNRLLKHLEYTAGKLAEIDELRRLLSGSESDVDVARLDYLIASVFSVRKYQAQVAAYETLLDSGNLQYLTGTKVRSALNSWQESLALMKEGESVVFDVRNQVMIPYMIEEFSFAAAIEQTSSVPQSTRRSRFRNNFGELQGNRKIDNMVAIQLTVRYTAQQSVSELLESTRAAIAAIAVQLEHK